MFRHVGLAIPSRLKPRPATGVVDITLFLTGEIELKQVWEAIVLPVAVVARGAGVVVVVVVVVVGVGRGEGVQVVVVVVAGVVVVVGVGVGVRV